MAAIPRSDDLNSLRYANLRIQVSDAMLHGCVTGKVSYGFSLGLGVPMRYGYRWIFILLGLVFVLLAAVDDFTFVGIRPTGTVGQVEKIASVAKDALLAIGVAILAVALIDMIWGQIGGDPLAAEIRKLSRLNDVIADAEKTGLVRVYGTITRDTDWKAYIDGCKAQIDLVGYQLLDLVDSDAVMEALERKASKGVEIRIVLPKDTMPGLQYAVSPKNIAAMRGNMVHAVNKFTDLRARLDPSAKFTLKVANDSMIIDAALRRFDEVMFVVHYLHAINTSDSPLFVFHNNGAGNSLFTTYSKWFDHVYREGKAVA